MGEEALNNRPEGGLVYLTAGDVELALDELDPLLLTRQVLELHATGSSTDLPDEAVLRWSPSGGGSARSINMPAAIFGEHPEVGTKIINANTANPGLGIPRADGLLVLFNYQTAAPICVMDAALISALRTAAVSVLGINELGVERPSKVAVIGSGELALRHVELVAERVRWVAEIALFDLEQDRAGRLAKLTDRAHRGVRVAASCSLTKACDGAAVVICTTTTDTPYLGLDQIQPGAVVVNVSLDDAFDDLLLGCDVLVVDDWGLVETDQKRALGKLVRSGKLRPHPDGSEDGDRRPLTTTLGECLTGSAIGRTSVEEIVVINPFGMALSDVAFGHAVARVAKQRGLGTILRR